MFSRAITKNKEKEKWFLEQNPEITSDEKKLLKKKNKRSRKTLLILGILSVLIVLIVMKYLDFLLGNVSTIFGWFGANLGIQRLNLFLPLGISFYTFQSIGYITDVYWGKYEAENNIFKFFLFMSFFPKIMQGPIIRYNEIKESLFAPHEFDYDNFTDGLKRMLWGYFKKMVIADCLVVFTTYCFANPMEIGGMEALLTVICFFIYDYCDFSGYMDIACGVSTCLGVKLPENFNHPYFALGIDDYWRRWHMTLGTWFKDYVFYPLSLSKFSLFLGKKSKKLFGKNASKVPAIFGLIVVWFLTGLWHGASWNYIAWGLYFGFIIILSIIFEPLISLFYSKTKIDKDKGFWRVIRHIKTLLLLAFGKILFETNSIGGAFEFIGRIFTAENFLDINAIIGHIGVPSLVVALVMSIAVLVVDIIQEKRPETTFIQKTKNAPLWVQWLMLGLLIVAIVWFGYYGEGLPKFQFGYMGF
ncbi:MAG: MBOAT family protein [Clostridia bacterium]|nr:MBOAT family protein [Clostridia bacterium]